MNRVDIRVEGADGDIRKKVAQTIANSFFDYADGSPLVNALVYNGTEILSDDERQSSSDLLKDYGDLQVVVSASSAEKGFEWLDNDDDDDDDDEDDEDELVESEYEPAIVAISKTISGFAIVTVLTTAVCFCFWIGHGAPKFWQ